MKQNSVERPLVSIIISVYNRFEYIEEAIASAISQDYQRIEVIVADDNSLESPLAIIESFQDNRVKLYRNTANLGPALNNINAAKKATGKYISFLNDDDVWGNDFLSKLVPILETNNDLVLAFSDHYIIDASGKIDHAASKLCTHTYKRDILVEGLYCDLYKLGLIDRAIPMVMATVLRKDYINWDNFKPQAADAYDLYLTYLVAQSGYNAYYLPLKLTSYRSHLNSGSGTGRPSWIRGTIFCYDQFIQDTNLSSHKPKLLKSLAKSKYTLGMLYLKRLQKQEARSFLLAALRKAPQTRCIIALILSFLPNNILKILLLYKFG